MCTHEFTFVLKVFNPFFTRKPKIEEIQNYGRILLMNVQETESKAFSKYIKSKTPGPSCSKRRRSLMSSLRVISLTVLADSIYNILIFFAENIFQQKNFSIFAYHLM